MIGRMALGSRAIGDIGGRELPSEWGGPELAARRNGERQAQPREIAHRTMVRKP